MSALSMHPNALEARELRRAEVMHAARCLFRDANWIGDIRTFDWLRRIHYMDRHEDTILGWLEQAGINPARRVRDLQREQRGRLIRQMLDFYNGGRK